MIDAPGRFLAALLLTVAVGLAGVVGVTVRVDPFGVWRNLGLSAGNRPTVTWSRIAAAERLRERCDVALVGSSRVVFGFAKHQRFEGNRLCNGALGGTSIRELSDVLDYIVEETDIRRVLLFVDLHMFHDGRGHNHDFAQSRFHAGRSRLAYYAWTATSLGALDQAARAVGRQLPLTEPEAPLGPSVAETRNMLRTTMFKANMYRRFEGPDATLGIFRDMLDRAEAAGVRVIVALPAVHAMQLEAEHDTGLWEVNRHWRRFLAEETARREVPLWDFATYHSAAVSPLPLTPREQNPWWADMSHQSQRLGLMTLERLAEGVHGRASTFEPRFGVALTPENVEAHLADLDAGRQAWHDAQPAQVAWYRGVVRYILRSDPEAEDDWDVNRRRAAGEAVAWGPAAGR